MGGARASGQVGGSMHATNVAFCPQCACMRPGVKRVRKSNLGKSCAKLAGHRAKVEITSLTSGKRNSHPSLVVLLLRGGGLRTRLAPRAADAAPTPAAADDQGGGVSSSAAAMIARARRRRAPVWPADVARALDVPLPAQPVRRGGSLLLLEHDVRLMASIHSNLTATSGSLCPAVLRTASCPLPPSPTATPTGRRID